MRCEVAEDSVVVLKSRPVKPGNGVEEKTRTTHGLFMGAVGDAKSAGGCEGMKLIRGFFEIDATFCSATSRPTGRGSFSSVPLDRALSNNGRLSE
jgi:hypothetical protein